MTRKLRKGIHYVNIKGQGRRKVKVLASGKWRFMKGGGKKRKGKKRGKRSGRVWVPGHYRKR